MGLDAIFLPLRVDGARGVDEGRRLQRRRGGRDLGVHDEVAVARAVSSLHLRRGLGQPIDGRGVGSAVSRLAAGGVFHRYSEMSVTLISRTGSSARVSSGSEVTVWIRPPSR